MKKLIAILILAIGSLNCSAQNNVPTPPTGEQTSPNLIGTHNLTGTTSITAVGGYSGGSTPGFISTANTIAFGYTTATAKYQYAVSTALRSSGMTWTGYNYSWDYLNQDMSRGTLAAKIAFDATDGTVLHSKDWTLGKTTDWTTVSGTETFATPMGITNLASFSLKFTGKDDRYWAGYYGPQVKNATMSINYTFDSCSTNPLSSPTCPGYAEAYKTQQCTANPLYDPSCPGYAAAYKTQQCAADATYDVSCPGYAAAYQVNQCTLDATYSVDCPGYEQAYLNKQCLKDSLFSNKCEGYATAYAIKYLTNLDPAVTTAVNQQLTTTNEVAKADPAKVTVVSSTVDSVLSTPSTTSATSMTSVTSVIAPSPPAATSPTGAAVTAAAAPPPPPPAAKQEEKAQDQKKTDAEVAKVEKKSGDGKTDAKKEVAAKAAEIAKNAGKAATLEAQVAQQGLLVGLMGYVPGFTGYQQATVPDTNGLEMARAYAKPVIDNRSAQRRLSASSESRWQEIVDSQYRN